MTVSDRRGTGPAQAGPRRAHKLSDEVLALLGQRLDADPGLRSADLSVAVAEQPGIRVHPRSIEPALGRPQRPKGGFGQ